MRGERPRVDITHVDAIIFQSRSWRNWQTRQVEGLVAHLGRVSSNLTERTHC